MKNLLLTFSMVLYALLAWSQYSVTGRVTDRETGEALNGAHIIFENTMLATVSRSDGLFALLNLKPKTYQLKISYIGYETIVKEVQVSKNISLNLALTPRAIMHDEFVITAVRAGHDAPFSFSSLDRNRIEEINTGRDIPFLLESLPSVVSTSDAGTGIGYTYFRIRGTDMNRINIMINGIPLNDAESHGVWWVNLPDFASSVENLQVQRGVGTSGHGAGAFGATINLQTGGHEPEPYARFRHGFGSFNTLRNTISFGSGTLGNNFHLDGRLSLITSDGFIDRASADLRSFNLSGSWHGRNTVVRANVFSGREVTYQAWNGIPSEILAVNRTYNGMGRFFLPDGEERFYENETDNYQQDHYQLFLTHQINRQTHLNVAFHYTRGLGYFEQFKVDHPFVNYGLEPIKLSGNYLVLAGDTLHFANNQIDNTDLIRRKYLDNHFYGLTWSLNRDWQNVKVTAGGSANRYDGDHYGTIIWSKFGGIHALNHRWYDNNGLKDDMNVFTKVSWQPASDWTIFGDLQFRRINYRIKGIDDDLRDISQEHVYNFLNPKAGIQYQPNNHHRFYLSYAKGQREPSRSNLTDANPAGQLPRSEVLHNMEGGYQFRSTNFSFFGNLYFMYYIDQLVLTGQINDVGAPIMTNVPESYRAGIELEMSVMPHPRWLIAGNATLSRNVITDFTEFVDNWDEWPTQIENPIGNTTISFSPWLIANGRLQFQPTEQISLSLSSKYVSKQYIDNTASNDRKLDPYMVSDLNLEWELNLPWTKQAGLQLTIHNLFDVEYESNAWVYRYILDNQYKAMDGFFPQAGIHFMAGINLGF